MSVAGTPSGDPYVIVPRERVRYEDQFKALKPQNGVVTGDQAKGFFLQSQLPPIILGQIWGLADTDADGKMDLYEFSIACKLINLKLRGYEIPKVLPPVMLASLKGQSPPTIPPLPNASLINAPPRPEPPKISAQPLISQSMIHNNTQPPMIPPQPAMVPIMSQPIMGQAQTQPIMMPPQQLLISTQPPVIPTGIVPPMQSVPPLVAAGVAAPASAHMSPMGVVQTSSNNTPRASVTSLDRVDSPQVEWAVPHQTKLKYTQIFNTMDRTRSGFLTGPQARNVMVQTKLAQNILAQIWALSDMDSDGRLGCEEFVLAMHLCEQASLGTMPPTALPPDMIPPSFRRMPRTVSRTASISSQGSGQPEAAVDLTLISQNSFEDKRKENFEKGQAELERRRKTLLDQQRKEAEERERKEREELEKREKARLEAERKRAEELEKQMREQQERERMMEEERKRQADQREAARKEMERQRQLEWEKQRLQELQQQRQREQENVLKLKAKNQSLSIELSTLNDHVKDLSQKICDTRVGVSNVKTTIDGMRSTRDTSMQEMSQLKNKLKEQNAKLLQLSQEKVKLDAKNKINSQMNEHQSEQTKQAYENKEITIKNLKEKLEDMEGEITTKMSDIENNNSQLTDLKTQLSELMNECEDLYSVYQQKKGTVLEMKDKKVKDFSTAWGNETSWGNEPDTASWPADNWGAEEKTVISNTETAPPSAVSSDPAAHGNVKYRALYEFVARNTDEISFQPGDIINVPLEQTGEPGWLAGEIRGHTGWFPESYVEPAEGVNVRGFEETVVAEPSPVAVVEDLESKRLEGIVEVPETIPEQPEMVQQPVAAAIEEEAEFYVASYPYQSVEQGDLTFNAGEIIGVIKKEGDWWTGKIDDRVGIFPSNYVQKMDLNATASEPPPPATTNSFNAEPKESLSEQLQQDAAANAQIDNEVSLINENSKPELEKTDFAVLAAQTQPRNNKKPDIASVIAPYQATSTEQLSLERGQLIMIRKKTDSGWWEGELQAKGRRRQVGWFPASYVKVLNSSGRASGRTTPVSSTRMQQEVVIDKVIALYPYTAANPDELSFLKDEIISVTAREEQAWWRGELNGVSGLFPSNYVSPLQQFQEDAASRKRKDCVNELVQTERAYIEDMAVVRDVFEAPLLESRVINKKEIENIFVNWQDILGCNRAFLQDLNKRIESGSDIVGDIICTHLPQMNVYAVFCRKQLDSAALLQNLFENSAPFREVVKKCQSHPATKGMPLSSFLIKPMQRITKYPLLIGKILENTPDNHADYANLKEAQVLADKFLKRINENVRQKEDWERLDWLQTYVQNDLNITFNGNTNKVGARKLIHFGIFSKVKSGKELVGFLLNDFLLLVQPSKVLSTQFTFQKNNNVSYKMYKQPLMVNELKVSKGSVESVEAGTDANRVLKLQDNKVTLALLTPSVNECSLWLKRIEAAKEMYEKVVSLTKPRPKTSRSFVQNIYCRVSLGDSVQNTNVAADSMNGNPPASQQANNGIPQPPSLIWNFSMQFPIRTIQDEMLTVAVYEMCPFSPDEFLGRADVKLRDLHAEYKARKVNGPITKKLILHQVESGEVVIKFDMQLFSDF
ncbi:PREDICTED: intersectin-1 isoform X2 [Nicrophorus vespilloides]|uniref:Intersectin-1 isoform X2 n=1 Tax=Nicrophorus vespilloides TaxID=110193 RepID=A0ABM1MD96_NICVS|nr:PREDICTED: intersectin-1 isoform X2 [Nicrophorus vespilloides]